MKDIAKKSFLLGLGAAVMTKKEAEKVVKELVKKNAVTAKEGKDMISKVRKYADKESKRVGKFVQQEMGRMAKDLGGVSKKQADALKRRLTSLNKELSSKGKQTLKKIMKDLAK